MKLIKDSIEKVRILNHEFEVTCLEIAVFIQDHIPWGDVYCDYLEGNGVIIQINNEIFSVWDIINSIENYGEVHRNNLTAL